LRAAGGRPRSVRLAPAALALALLGGCRARAAAEPAPELRTPKVLLVFIDGFLPDVLDSDAVPNLRRLERSGAWSRRARAESASISGAGWSTFLTGVHTDKHGVPDNRFESPRYERYRPLTELLREARPGSEVALSVCWDPLWEALLAPLAYPRASNHEEPQARTDWFDADSNDTRVTQDVVDWLTDPEVELALAMFGESDEVAHSDGNLHYDAYDPLYRRILAKLDGHVGALLAAIEARPTFAREDWLVIVSSDHAGELGRGHGANRPAQLAMPLIVCAPWGSGSVVPGEIWPPPAAVDVVPTALAHLGVAARSEWELDGVVLARRATAPPRATLDTNLIFNGGAEHERGYAGTTGQPDACLAGWDDPGGMTAVAYGAPEFPRAGDALPAAHGASFFAGGAGGDSAITQTIDLGPLARALRAGADYELSGWLGGYAAQDDRCLVTATFYAADGRILARGVLAPVRASDRGGRTGFVERRGGGPVPAEAAHVVVCVEALASEGANDGYADELALVIRAR
jgi:hypothetical protein